MANRVLESLSSTITIDISSPGYVSLDVNQISANQVTGLSPSATVDTTNATNISSGSFKGIANNTNFVGSVSAVNVVSNAQLSGNLGNYQTTAGLTANIAAYISGYTGNLEANVFYIGNSTVNLVTNATSLYIANSTSNSLLGSGSLSLGNSTVYSTMSPSTFTVANSITNSQISVSSLVFGNGSVNSAVNVNSYVFNSPGVSVIRPFFSVLAANNALAANSNTAVQSVFPTGQKTVTLSATTVYLIDAMYMVSNASISANTQLQTAFGNSAAIGSAYYTAFSCLANNDVPTSYGAATNNALGTAVYATSLSATTVTLPSTNGVVNLTAVIHLKGSVLTGAANTTITPQLAYTSACNSTPQVLAGSYITFTPVCNTTAGSSNTWGTWA